MTRALLLLVLMAACGAAVAPPPRPAPVRPLGRIFWRCSVNGVTVEVASEAPPELTCAAPPCAVVCGTFPLHGQ